MANKRARKKALQKATRPTAPKQTRTEKALSDIFKVGKKLSFKQAYGLSRRERQKGYEASYNKDIVNIEKALAQMEEAEATKRQKQREQFTSETEISSKNYYTDIVYSYLAGIQNYRSQINPNKKMTPARKRALSELNDNINYLTNYIKDMVNDLGIEFVGQWIKTATEHGLFPKMEELYKSEYLLMFIDQFEAIAPKDIDPEFKASIASAEMDISSYLAESSLEVKPKPEKVWDPVNKVWVYL